MIRRILCMIITIFLLSAALSASAEKAANRYSYDFDLTFSLNAEAFPRILRSGASGYAELVNRLGVRGNVAWSDAKSGSMELNATLYFTDNDTVTYPFRIFGIPSRIYITSPLIQNEVLFLNMTGLMEFAIKARNTLNIPLGYAALLYPYATENAFAELSKAWRKTVKSVNKNKKLSLNTLKSFSGTIEEQLLNNKYLQYWIQVLAEGSQSQSAVEYVFSALPDYYQLISGNRNLDISISDQNQVWKNKAGQTLYSYTESDRSVSVDLTLPAETYGYLPLFSFTRETGDRSFSFACHASLYRDKTAVEPGSLQDADVYAYDEEEIIDEDELYPDDESPVIEENDEDVCVWPDCLLDCSFTGTGIPLSLPADASFSLTAVINGAAYPNCAFELQGETKNDGSLTVGLYKPPVGDSVQEMILSCSGTVFPGDIKELPNYKKYDFQNTYNVFSFNEASLAEFNSKVLPSLIRSVISFVEASPTAACQCFLDDLTEMGVLDMLLN